MNGQLLTHNAPHILHAGDTICIGDTILTFQISDQFPNLSQDIPPPNEKSPTWEGSDTDRYARVEYRPDVNYPLAESQKNRHRSSQITQRTIQFGRLYLLLLLRKLTKFLLWRTHIDPFIRLEIHLLDLVEKSWYLF